MAKKKKFKLDPKRPHQCNFCGRGFARESTLIGHVCEKKRRWMNKDEQYVRLGFQAWNRFYSLTQTFKQGKIRTYEDFIESKFYTAFTKFGRHILNINAIRPEEFIDFVIKTNVRLDDWTKDYIYEIYVRELSKKEPADIAVERNILLMQQWSLETGEDWTDFFKKVNTQLATSWIRAGRLSPWLLYSVDSSRDLFDRLTEEQLGMLEESLNPPFWKMKLKQNQDDVKFIKKIFRKAGM